MHAISLKKIEQHNRGWLKPAVCPPVRVYLDGIELRRVTAVNRRKGRVRVCDEPLRIDRRGKSVVTRTLYGRVTVELIR